MRSILTWGIDAFVTHWSMIAISVSMINVSVVYAVKRKIRSIIKHHYNCCIKPTVDPVYIAENILNREFSSDKPNGKWVTDVGGFKYGSYKDKH